MDKGLKIVAVVGITLLISYFVIVGIIFYGTTTFNNQHMNYCTTWKQNIEERRTDLDTSFWAQLKGDAYDQLNRDIDNYNYQCANK